MSPLQQYYLFAFGISWSLVWLGSDGLQARDTDAALILVVAGMLFGPAVASIGVTYRIGGAKGVRDMLSSMANFRVPLVPWWAVAILLAPVTMGVTLFGLYSCWPNDNGFRPGVLDAEGVLSYAPTFFGILLTTTGEEIGWTGSVVPRYREKYVLLLL